MLTFSHEDIVLEYREKKNLMGALELKNHSNSSIYYKFKVNRPKFYLVKPDRGVILPGETKKIQFTLHRDGLSEALNDRFKCFYTLISQGLDIESLSNFQDQPNTTKTKLLVKITKLPSGVNIFTPSPENKGSELKSLGAGSQYHSTFRGSRNPSTLQDIIKQKQDRVGLLKREIEQIQSDKKFKIPSISEKQKSSIIPILFAIMLGLMIGAVSSVWI